MRNVFCLYFYSFFLRSFETQRFLLVQIMFMFREFKILPQQEIYLIDMTMAESRHNFFFSHLYYSKLDNELSYSLLRLLRNRLLRHGMVRGLNVFENFLIFLKMSALVNPMDFLSDRFMETYFLPYRVYMVKFSNRNYYFPGPILSDQEYQSLLLKNFSIALRKQAITECFLDQFFIEIIAFFEKANNSFLLRQLDEINNLGFENRAFLHYRWFLKNQTNNKQSWALKDLFGP